MTDGDQPATGELEAELAGVRDLVARVASVSMEETERVIKKLKNMRDMLRNEGDRVQREVRTYVDDSQATITSLKLVAEDLARRAGR